ncbi:hypothetical protein BJY04DRAFT_179656 [Aspergillus karnatakaensis]|uniref:uncharacterized protein n=1 Tax=Aspergillus karnatakaensis TaxID=1810916 RepID=UPI003CCDAAE6
MWLSLLPLGFSLVASGIPGAAAQECGGSLIDYEEIHSQEDIDAITDKCTTLRYGYQVTTNFTGPFSLPGIVNVSELIAGSDGSGRLLDIPSFELPDLEYAKRLYLQLGDNLETLSAPKLVSAESLSVYTPAHLDVLDVPALKEVYYLTLRGNFSDVTFGALDTVHDEIWISNRLLSASPDTLGETSLNISFPLVTSASAIIIGGKTSSISFPELTELTDSWNTIPGYRASNFTLWGESLPLDLPRLATVDGNLLVAGNISSLSLPDLRSIKGNLTINAGDPLSIELPSLYAAKVIELTGKIESVDLPALFAFDLLRIDSELPLDCDAIVETYASSTLRNEVTCVSAEGSGGDESEDNEDETTDQGGEGSETESSSSEGSDEAANGDADAEGSTPDNDNGSTTLALDLKRGISVAVATSLLLVGLVEVVF